jgi:hypothetical protein
MVSELNIPIIDLRKKLFEKGYDLLSLIPLKCKAILTNAEIK